MIAIADAGFDGGLGGQVHPALMGRVLKLYPINGDDGADLNGHGTHVWGSAVAMVRQKTMGAS